MTNLYWPTTNEPDTLGPLLGADDVRDAMRDTIDLWAPYYIGVLSERLYAASRIGNKNPNPNPLPNFGKWTNTPDYRTIGTGQPASYQVRVIGADDTEMQANGRVAAMYRCRVDLQCWGTSWFEAADLTSWYEKVIRWCILQHRSLGGLANATRWISTSYSGTEHSSTRTLGEAVVMFDVALLNTIDMSAGPLAPLTPPNPPPPDYTVETVLVDLTKVPVTEPLNEE
jgi:hypothetical protein